MLKFGLIGLGLSGGCAVSLSLLIRAGVAHFGPCGPDAVGMVLLLGFLSTGGLGALITVAGLLEIGFRRILH